MNTDNYCSLEISRKLVEAGIVLETEYYYVFGQPPIKGRLPIMTKREILESVQVSPAPSMAELWRELPFQTYAKMMDDGRTLTWICDDEHIESEKILNTNPADALAELLIWVRKERV